jgi:RNA polymerase sigma-70 factor (ECF subfamily)
MTIDADPDARLTGILTTYGPSLRRLAQAWTRSAAERDDLLQDIAVALLRALPTHRGECSERTFVWRVAHNRAITHAQRRKRQPSSTDMEPGDVASDAPNPEERASHAQQRALLMSAMRRLREDQRVVVLLSLEDVTLEDIGAIVGVSANAAGVRLHRARAALLGHLQDIQAERSKTQQRSMR